MNRMPLSEAFTDAIGRLKTLPDGSSPSHWGAYVLLGTTTSMTGETEPQPESLNSNGTQWYLHYWVTPDGRSEGFVDDDD